MRLSCCRILQIYIAILSVLHTLDDAAVILALPEHAAMNAVRLSWRPHVRLCIASGAPLNRLRVHSNLYSSSKACVRAEPERTAVTDPTVAISSVEAAATLERIYTEPSAPEATYAPTRRNSKAVIKQAPYLLAQYWRLQSLVEQRLGGEIGGLAAAIGFAFGAIFLEYGVQGILDHYFGDSVFGGLCCAATGLAIVFGIRLQGWQPIDLWGRANH